MRRVFLLASVSSAISAACSLVDLSGLTSASADAGSGTGNEAAVESGTPDGPGDGGPGSSDATADALGDAREAAQMPFCATVSPTPELCADFDEGAYAASFSNVSVSSASSLGADSKASVSPPNSLYASLPVADAGGGGDDAFMTRLFAGTASTRVTYDFDVRIDSWVTGGADAIIGAIHIDDGQGDEHTLTLYVGDGTTGLEESFATVDGSAVYLDHNLNVAVQLGTWTHVSYTLDLAGMTCSASLDGVTQLAPTPIDSSWFVGPPAVDLGLTYASDESVPWSVRYDNVVVRWQ